jgi:hypothetical protein
MVKTLASIEKPTRENKTDEYRGIQIKHKLTHTNYGSRVS